MKSLKYLIPAGILLAMASAANASQVQTGYIIALDPAHETLTLNTGTTFLVSEVVDMSRVDVGKQALVAFNVVNGTPVAISVIAGDFPLSYATPETDMPSADQQ